MRQRTLQHDVVIVGSGFGGCLAALPLVRAGYDVLMVERGDWVERSARNWAPEGTLPRTRHFADGLLRVAGNGRKRREGMTACVGGPSVFYGGVSARFRRRDFEPHPEIVGDSGARWPVGYEEIRPYYAEAERLLGVAGAGDDPTTPPRENGYPQPPDGLSGTSEMIAGAARRLGLTPYRLPLAINFGLSDRRPTCVACPTCDTYACALGAKNDLASRLLPALLVEGLELRPRTAVVGLRAEGERLARAEARDLATGEELRIEADRFVLAAGALGTAQLLLAAGLEDANPAGDAVGRYLTRHCASIVFGCYPRLPDGGRRFHKQVGFNDFYFGDPEGDAPPGKLGNIQQVQSPSRGSVATALPRPLPRLLGPLLRRSTGLLVLAEDQPRSANRLDLDAGDRDRFGLPRLVVRHAHSDRDLRARAALARRAREIHREAGALFCYEHRIDTFSHALGTVRMGEDPSTAPLTPDGRYRGLRNLWITDGSAFPTSAGVNPSLTIAANALRIGAGIAASARPEARRAGSALRG